MMKNSLIRLLVKGLILVVLTAVFTGCSSLNKKFEPDPVPSDSSKRHILKPVKLKMYIIGTPAKNEAEGLELINKALREKINATLELASISWGDYNQKMPVLLASGEPYDMIYSSNWAFFTTEGPKGAYTALNDLLPQYAPTVWKEIPMDAWEQVSINNEIYMIPSTILNFQTHGILIREDLRVKYGVPEIKSMEDYGVYLDAIKKNEPNLVPYNAMGSHLMNLCMFYELDWSTPMTGSIGELVYDLNAPDRAFIISDTAEYEAFVKRQREWYLKGYWTKEVLSNKTLPNDSFKNEQSASTIVNLGNANNIYEFVQQKKLPWELRYYSIEGNSKIARTPYLGNGTSIYRNSPNPDRALMFIELLYTDRDFYDMVIHGVRGKNYELTPDGKTKVPEGINPIDAAWSNISMGLGHLKFYRPSSTKWTDIIKLEQEYDRVAMSEKLSGFMLDIENISAEIAAVNNVCATYKLPLDWGVIDPVRGLPDLRKKLREAGIDKLLAEVNKQIAAYNNNQ
jgi:putative aldouronate transport system substrate-binding protein